MMTEREEVKKKIKNEPELEDETSSPSNSFEDEPSSSATEDNDFDVKKEQSEHKIIKCKREPDDDDDIQEILEKIRAEEQLPLTKVQSLRDLVIKLRHKVPPQHEVERACGSHVPTPEEKQAFKEIIHPYHMKKGMFTPNEDEKIAVNWKAFCKIHNWNKSNPKPFMYMRHNVGFYLAKWEERRKFVQFLADGLPYRTLYSVYHRFRNLYDNPKVRSKYSYKEDHYIIKHIERTKNIDRTRVYADLAKVLNRTRASVWRRYRLLKEQKKDSSG